MSCTRLPKRKSSNEGTAPRQRPRWRDAGFLPPRRKDAKKTFPFLGDLGQVLLGALGVHLRIQMSNDTIAVLGFVALFVLMLLRVPVGMAMGLVGVTGYSVIVGPGPALKLVGQTSMRTVTDYTFGVIPMFMLMGAFVSASGLSREMFKAADGFLGHLRGGLGIATVVACGGFAAICGSSVATAAPFAAGAYPEMRRFGHTHT